MSIIGNALNMTSVPQRILVGVLGAGILAAGGFNVAQGIENRHLAAEKTKLAAEINDPSTGFVVRLTQAKANSAICTDAVNRQTAALKALSTKDAATVAAVQARYDVEHAERLRAEKVAAAFLAHKPQGATLQERVIDVDAQILGDLK